MGKGKSKRSKLKFDRNNPTDRAIAELFAQQGEIIDMSEPEDDLTRPNIRIYRDDIMRAVETMLDRYTWRAARDLREEFVRALDGVVSGYRGEVALNQLVKKGTKYDTRRSTTVESRR